MVETNFERYDAEFTTLVMQIEESLNQEPPNQYTSNLLQQCDDLVKQMALEARSADSAKLKRELLQQVRECKSKLQKLQAQSDRQGLLASGNGRGNHDERMKLQKNEDSLMAQNETLDRARRTMQETESVALEITEELGNNREKLMSSHARVREVSGLTGRASRVLRSMNQRAVQQKMIMYGVLVALVVGFLIMVYSLWR